MLCFGLLASVVSSSEVRELATIQTIQMEARKGSIFLACTDTSDAPILAKVRKAAELHHEAQEHAPVPFYSTTDPAATSKFCNNTSPGFVMLKEKATVVRMFDGEVATVVPEALESFATHHKVGRVCTLWQSPFV